MTAAAIYLYFNGAFVSWLLLSCIPVRVPDARMMIRISAISAVWPLLPILIAVASWRADEDHRHGI